MEIPEIIIPQMNGFSIYDPATGLFSKGGMPPTWGKKGKIWNSIGALKNHLNGALVFMEYANKWNGLDKSRFKVYPYYKTAIIVEVSSNKKFAMEIKDYISLYIANKKAESKYYADCDIVWL